MSSESSSSSQTVVQQPIAIAYFKNFSLDDILVSLCSLSSNLVFGIELPKVQIKQGNTCRMLKIPGTHLVFTKDIFCNLPENKEQPFVRQGNVVWFYPLDVVISPSTGQPIRADCISILNSYKGLIETGDLPLVIAPSWSATTNRLSNLVALHMATMQQGELWLGIKVPKEEERLEIFNYTNNLFPLAVEEGTSNLERILEKLHYKSVPGTQLYYSVDSTRCNHMLYRQDQIFFLRSVGVITPDSLFGFLSIVNLLHLMLKNTFLCLEDNYQEAKHFMDSCVKPREKEYTPITGNFLGFLSDCVANLGSVYINPKYDGKTCWIFTSKTTPVLYIESVKAKGKMRYKIKGACSDTMLPSEFPHNRVGLCCEDVDGKLIAYDCCTDEKLEYGKRIQLVRLAIDAVKSNNSMIKLACTQGKLLGKKGESLLNLLNHQLPNTDGVVVYCGQNRPLKLKVTQNMTVDLVYKLAPSLTDEEGNIVGEWQTGLTNESRASTMFKDWISTLHSTKIPEELTPSLEEISTVYEVRVADCSVVRKRPDRECGNPIGLVEKIVEMYEKDKVHSNLLTWSGQDLTLATAFNRTFKRYALLSFVPKDSMIIDMGSGFLGDLPIWKDLGYKVIAVEKDSERHEQAKQKAKSYTKVICVNSAMEDFDFFDNKFLHYRWCVFMRSINMVSNNQRKSLLANVMKTNRSILVVCTVSDTLSKVLVQGSFEANSRITEEGIKLTATNSNLSVQYNLGEKQTSVQTKRTYVDHLWSWTEWKEFAKEHGYSAKVYKEQSMIQNIFGVDTSRSADCLKLCNLDVVMVFTKGLQTKDD